MCYPQILLCAIKLLQMSLLIFFSIITFYLFERERKKDFSLHWFTVAKSRSGQGQWPGIQPVFRWGGSRILRIDAMTSCFPGSTALAGSRRQKQSRGRNPSSWIQDGVVTSRVLTTVCALAGDSWVRWFLSTVPRSHHAEACSCARPRFRTWDRHVIWAWSVFLSIVQGKKCYLEFKGARN